MTPKQKDASMDLRTGWASVSKSELSMIAVRTRRSQYAEVLDSFLESDDIAQKKEGLTASQVAGLQSQKSKDAYKGKISLRTHQEESTKKGEPYKGKYTVILVREPYDFQLKPPKTRTA